MILGLGSVLDLEAQESPEDVWNKELNVDTVESVAKEAKRIKNWSLGIFRQNSPRQLRKSGQRSEGN